MLLALDLKFKLRWSTYILRMKGFSQTCEESISSNKYDHVFYNSKKHLYLAFFAKIKIDPCKWPLVIKNTCMSVFSSS